MAKPNGLCMNANCSFNDLAHCFYDGEETLKPCKPIIPKDEDEDMSNNTIPENVRRFTEIADGLAKTYAKKNADYGNSFSESIEEYGLVAGAARLGDKYNRMKKIIKGHDPLVKEESLYDTCIDGACYFIMLAMEIEKLNTKAGDVS